MLDTDLLPLSNARVSLRPLRADDAHSFAEGASDPDVQRFAHLPEPTYTPEIAARMIESDAREGLERGDLAVLALADPTSGSFAGSLVLFDVTDDGAEVGFWVHPGHRGKGMAGAGIELAAEFASRSGLAWLTARTMPENQASVRVLARAGFVETSRSRGTTPSGESCELVHFVRFIGDGVPLPSRTERLVLRAHAAGDDAWLQRIYSDGDVARYLLDEPWTEADARSRVTERIEQVGLETEAGALALVVERDGMPVGDVVVWWTDRERRVAEIGWVLSPEHSGHGYASEVVGVVLEMAFRRYRLHRVVARMDARNEASARLAERVGMTREAHLREDWWSKGEWTDTLVFATLASDRLR